ncbi:hypothetical protein K469DRAFT_752133 [Zopfia rhizophila CBS 207.26]|uniref:Uncharacterized protein n=1 Tax=Zopfia rhizophila CBS 207.26 TaxID=1314779 RepID=A0A6A6DAU3_9PEZI|nr:hypothetical protein K469DRAFT_756259 [Zopfia rhizophila CBS 207.26]KAF2182307.1 hypothetical protein K469DRAFT_752133 [Zopfia rhizophila CBS 207.26]
MPVPKRGRGRPPKYATDEERKAARQRTKHDSYQRRKDARHEQEQQQQEQPNCDMSRLVWVDTKEVGGEPGYFNPRLDELLHVPGNEGYLGRGLHSVRGNVLRGRKTNLDTLNIWYIDDFQVNNLTTNQSLHGTIPTLVGDTWGEMIWKGPIVAVMKVGNKWDPRRVMDITLTAYRDAIDYLGYFHDGYGSMVDGIATEDRLSKKVLADRAGKVKGVRINCLGDQTSDGARQLVQVDVPKTHPLFNLEGDDPLDVPEHLGWEWVVKSYTNRRESGTRDSG